MDFIGPNKNALGNLATKKLLVSCLTKRNERNETNERENMREGRETLPRRCLHQSFVSIRSFRVVKKLNLLVARLPRVVFLVAH